MLENNKQKQQTVEYIDMTKVTLHNGKWYAFDLEGHKFFATVYNNGLTGFLELTKISNPYIKDANE